VRPPAEGSADFTRHSGVTASQESMFKWLVGLWVFFLPVQLSMPKFPISRFAPSDLVLVVFLAYFLLTGVTYDRRLWPISVSFLVLSYLFANLVFTLSTGEISRWAIWSRTVGLLVLVLSFLMVSLYGSMRWQNIHAIIRLFIRVVTIHALVAILIWRLGLNERFHANYMGTRLSGFLIDPSAFGGLLACAFALAIVVYFRRGALYRPVEGVISVSILALGTFLTYSRSCWIALLAGLAFMLFTRKVTHTIASTIVLSVVVMVVYLTIPIALDSKSADEAWASSAQMATRGTTIESRMTYNREALSLFLESPIWGKGLGYFEAIPGRGVVHNTYLWILAEFGAVGFAVFMWFLFTFFNRGRYTSARSRDEPLPVNSGLLAAFVAMAALALGVESLNQRHWWFVMALLSSSYVLTRRDEGPAGRGTF